MVGRYFVRKYGLPVTHPCYLARAEAEWLEEMYADLYFEQEQVAFSLAHLSGSGLDAAGQMKERTRLQGEAHRLAKALGEATEERDTLLDDLEARMARGEAVDMSMLLPKGFKARTR